jgi:hypothetical protein
MPLALFTPTNRDNLAITIVFPEAVHVSKGKDEDVFDVYQVRVTCRYWMEGGDFVSKQCLGCGTAIRSGQLKCAKRKAAEAMVDETQTVLGIVGPDKAVLAVAEKLAKALTGVIIHSDKAVLVG